jgi:hypothetical protein
MNGKKVNFSHNDIFLPELIFINQEEALPGGISVPETEP